MDWLGCCERGVQNYSVRLGICVGAATGDGGSSFAEREVTHEKVDVRGFVAATDRYHEDKAGLCFASRRGARGKDGSESQQKRKVLLSETTEANKAVRRHFAARWSRAFKCWFIGSTFDPSSCALPSFCHFSTIFVNLFIYL